jgi:hypothetical protein
MGHECRLSLEWLALLVLLRLKIKAEMLNA